MRALRARPSRSVPPSEISSNSQWGLERIGRSAVKSALDGYLHRPLPAIFDADTEGCISCHLDLAKAREQQPAMRQCSNAACEKRSIAEWLRPRIPCRHRERLRSKGKRMA